VYDLILKDEAMLSHGQLFCKECKKTFFAEEAAVSCEISDLNDGQRLSVDITIRCPHCPATNKYHTRQIDISHTGYRVVKVS